MLAVSVAGCAPDVHVVPPYAKSRRISSYTEKCRKAPPAPKGGSNDSTIRVRSKLRPRRRDPTRSRAVTLDLATQIHNSTVVDRLGLTFSALSDGTRRAILVRLKDGPRSAHELAAPFGISQQAISKHLAYLERARLIEKRREGRESVCTLRPEPMREVAGWVAQYRTFWEGAFDELDALLHELHPRAKRSTKKA